MSAGGSVRVYRLVPSERAGPLTRELWLEPPGLRATLDRNGGWGVPRVPETERVGPGTPEKSNKHQFNAG